METRTASSTRESRGSRKTREARRRSTADTSSRALGQVSNIFGEDEYAGRNHTAKEGGAAPLPAGRATPGPAANVDEIPPGALFPSRALGSAGGGDSTESEMMWAPRTIVKPNVRFSSVSMVCDEELLPGAAGLFCLRFTRRNSSVSARTRFMCCCCQLRSARYQGEE